MDLSVSKLRTSCPQASGSQTLYQPFATPAPPAINRSYSANTLTPGMIPSPLNFPSLTPPSSPFYGLYSPSPRQHVSPLYDPSYLRKLKSNPIFRDLQSVLVQECMQMQVPANLITTSWNLMQLNPTTTNETTTVNNSLSSHPETSNNNNNKVYARHMALQDKILKVRIDPAVSADGLSAENDYSEQVGKIEMDRYRALNSCPTQVKSTINDYYDKERLALADRTEAEFDKLIKKAENMRKSVTCAVTEKVATDFVVNVERSAEQSKQLSDKMNGKVDGASLLLQQEEKMNAVRKLQFNSSEDHLSNNDEDDDYLNYSVNSEDFEISEIDVETVDNDETSEITPHPDSPQLQSSMVSQSKSGDLLQQCITESGIVEDHQTFLPPHNSSTDNSDCTSPMSLESVKSTSSPDQNTSQSSTNQIPDLPKFQSSLTNQESPFSLSSLYQPPGKFLPLENINMALSHMQKICSGPSATFTPESRRDYTPNFTSDIISPKMLPFSDLSQNYPPHNSLSTYNMNSIRHPAQKYPTHSSTWHCPVTQPGTTTTDWSTPTSTQQGTRQTSQSRKRKSPCDEGDVSTDLMNNNINQNSRFVGESDLGQLSENDLEPKNPVFRTHRMLTAEATNVLSHWYHSHVHYPYPNEEEVEQLARVTGITNRQVKKWMANKRVRCYNTLSITGNQHPIKYKYKGHGRNKKSSSSAVSEKENTCDSTTADKKPNYSMLNESAKQILSNWYENHLSNPYPTEEEKKGLAEMCSITVSQVKSWFANKRNRTNNTKKQVPNYFLSKHPEYSNLVQMVGQKREESRMIKRRKMNEVMYIQPQFYF